MKSQCNVKSLCNACSGALVPFDQRDFQIHNPKSLTSKNYSFTLWGHVSLKPRCFVCQCTPQVRWVFRLSMYPQVRCLSCPHVLYDGTLAVSQFTMFVPAAST